MDEGRTSTYGRRKLITRYKEQSADIDGLSVLRKDGGRGRVSIKYSIVTSIRRLEAPRKNTTRKKHKPHKGQQNYNCKKTKMGRKITE